MSPRLQDGSAAPRPVIGLLCCNEQLDRPVQTVASRFVAPLAALSGASALLVPALADMLDVAAIGSRLGGLLLTGSRSNVSPWRYGGVDDGAALDEQRDEVALRLAGAMIEAGKPVFGICRGLQELNVLFGGTLRDVDSLRHHHPEPEGIGYDGLFGHRHPLSLEPGSLLAAGACNSAISVNSVHRQGIDRLGGGLEIEARAEDGLVEAFRSRPCGGDVLAVQWHPEWDTAGCGASQAFFATLGAALDASAAAR